MHPQARTKVGGLVSAGIFVVHQLWFRLGNVEPDVIAASWGFLFPAWFGCWALALGTGLRSIKPGLPRVLCAAGAGCLGGAAGLALLLAIGMVCGAPRLMCTALFLGGVVMGVGGISVVEALAITTVWRDPRCCRYRLPAVLALGALTTCLVLLGAWVVVQTLAPGGGVSPLSAPLPRGPVTAPVPSQATFGSAAVSAEVRIGLPHSAPPTRRV